MSIALFYRQTIHFSPSASEVVIQFLCTSSDKYFIIYDSFISKVSFRERRMYSGLFGNWDLLVVNAFRQCNPSENELELMPGRLLVYKVLLCALMCRVFLPRLTK